MTSPDPGSECFTLLGEGEPEPVTIRNPHGRAQCILTCEHAGTAVPAMLGLLGLEEDDYKKHYAVDIGIRRVTETLSDLLDAPAIFGNYSRLVVDLNRDLAHPTAFVTAGEGKPIPGNIAMAEEERAARIREIYDPYNTALAALLDRAVAEHSHPAVISMHSFTPQYFQFRRPWQTGFLWTHDARMATAMIGFFEKSGYSAGNNQPYDHRIVRGSAINRHADVRQLPNVLVEIRNDLISNDKDADFWAKLFADCVHEILADKSVCSYYDGPLTEYDAERERRYYEELIEKSKKGEHYG